MSKKSIPFKLAPRPSVAAVAGVVDAVGSPAASAEAWVQRPQMTTEESASQLQARSSDRNIFVLRDNPTWLDVMLAVTVLPSMTWWLWVLGGFRSTSGNR
jgi:hypothetical protein